MALSGRTVWDDVPTSQEGKTALTRPFAHPPSTPRAMPQSQHKPLDNMWRGERPRSCSRSCSCKRDLALATALALALALALAPAPAPARALALALALAPALALLLLLVRVLLQLPGNVFDGQCLWRAAFLTAG